MSASTGIGGLVVGMAMLAVFIIFVGTLDARLATHLGDRHGYHLGDNLGHMHVLQSHAQAHRCRWHGREV